MKKLIITLLLVGVFLRFAESASASLLVVNKEGEIVWNVLSDEDSLAITTPEKSQIEVKNVARGGDRDSAILLKKEDKKIVLSVGREGKLDVTKWNEDLVEIEERGDVKKIVILIQDGNFVINQGEILARTSFPINIDAKENELSLVTDSGNIYLSVLPQEATETVLRSSFVSRIIDKNLEIAEKKLGVLTYTVRGEKNINIFNLIDLKIPVTSFVSTTTGEIVSVDQPKWLSIFGFLFS